MRYSLRDKNCCQKVILIYDSACPHTVQSIQTLLKDFHWEQFKQSPYSLDLMPSDYHLFPQLKKELDGQCFQT